MPRISIAGTAISGFADQANALDRRVADGREILVLPIATGGSMGAAYALVFARAHGVRRYIGNLHSDGGHLDVHFRGDVLNAQTRLYSANDGAECCAARTLITSYTIHGTRLIATGRRVYKFKREVVVYPDQPSMSDAEIEKWLVPSPRIIEYRRAMKPDGKFDRVKVIGTHGRVYGDRNDYGLVRGRLANGNEIVALPLSNKHSVDSALVSTKRTGNATVYRLCIDR